MYAKRAPAIYTGEHFGKSPASFFSLMKGI